MFKKIKTYLVVCVTFIAFNALSQNGWYQKASHGGDARHRCTAFSIGNKGYFGGGHINSGLTITHKDYWQYDPSTNTWTQIADFGGGARYHSTAFTIGNWAYVGLGEDGADTYHNDFWKYSPIVNTWFPTTDLPGNPRRGAVSFVINEEGYVGTGQSDFGYEVDFYKFNAENETWTPVADFLGEARSGSVAFAHNGKGYVGTGHILGDATKDFYEYDPTTDSWSQKTNVGTYLRQDATGFVLNGKGYIVTGNNVTGDSTYRDVWQYDFETDSWIEQEEFPGARRRYMVSFVIDDIAYAGSGTNGTNLKDFWAFQPLLNAESKQLTSITIGPNPSSDFISIKSDLNNVQMSIFDLNGRLLLQQNFSKSIQVCKEKIGRGMFILRLEHDGEFTNRKIKFI